MQKPIRPLFSLFRNSVQEIDEQKKSITHYISCGEPNDYGQVLTPTGYDDTRFRKNPIVLFQHGLNDFFSTTPARTQLDFVLGRNTKISVEGNYLKAETEFRTDENAAFASDVYNLYKLGFLNGWSKWFYPVSEPRASGNGSDGYTYYDKWGIYEYSAVFVPVDGDATTKEANLLHALDSVKSESMKQYFVHSFFAGSAASSTEFAGLSSELSTIRNEINRLGESGSSAAEELRTEYGRISDEKIKQYHKLILPQLEHFAVNIKQLNDLKFNLEALIENAVSKSLRSITGKID